MKPSDHLKTTIQNYLTERAQKDALFAVRYDNPKKNIDDCVTYILNTVKKSECNGFTDDEIYSMAVHYYDEENIEVGKSLQCQVVVNHTIQLTEEEKEEARQTALQRAQEEAYRKMTQPKKKSKKTDNNNLPSLF